MPIHESFSVTFTLRLPAGFLLDQQATALVSELLNGYQLIITPTGNGGWRFEIKPKTGLRSGEVTEYRKLVNIVYTISGESVSEGDYEIKLTDVNLQMNSGGTVHQDEITVPVHVTPTANTTVEVTSVTSVNGLLTVNTPQAEQVSVYSVNGMLVYQAQKETGKAMFDLSRLPAGVYIVKGESRWTRKIRKD